MKRFFFRLSIALLAFFAGLWITSAYLFFTQIPEVNAVSEEERVLAYIGSAESPLEISYDWKSMKWSKGKGRFLITNQSDSSVYYLAYEKNQHFDNHTKQNGKVRMGTYYICHMEMEWQELKPNESLSLEIDIPRNRKPFEAGFDFLLNEEQQARTFWIDVNKE